MTLKEVYERVLNLIQLERANEEAADDAVLKALYKCKADSFAECAILLETIDELKPPAA